MWTAPGTRTRSLGIRSATRCHCARAALILTQHLHSIEFQPTSTNIFELESNPLYLYRSGTNAHPPFQLAHQGYDPRTFGLWTQHTSSAPVSTYSLRAIDIQCTVALLMFVVVRIIGVQVVDCWVLCVLILFDAAPVEGCITSTVRLIRWPLSHDNITRDIRVDPIVDKDDRGRLNGKTEMEGMKFVLEEGGECSHAAAYSQVTSHMTIVCGGGLNGFLAMVVTWWRADFWPS